MRPAALPWNGKEDKDVDRVNASVVRNKFSRDESDCDNPIGKFQPMGDVVDPSVGALKNSQRTRRSAGCMGCPCRTPACRVCELLVLDESWMTQQSRTCDVVARVTRRVVVITLAQAQAKL